MLAAITEIIKEKNGKETETEYFGALMTALETMEGEETIAAVAYLLSLAIRKWVESAWTQFMYELSILISLYPRVPQPVLRKKFSAISKALVSSMAAHSETSSAALMRGVSLNLSYYHDWCI